MFFKRSRSSRGPIEGHFESFGERKKEAFRLFWSLEMYSLKVQGGGCL